MPMVEDILAGLGMVLAWDNLFWSFFGVSFGMLMGAVPGLTDNMAIVLLLPFTFYLNPIAGISMLMGLSKGGNFGGSIPAILFNIPGTPQAMVTCLDGYPLTQQGKSGKALKMALYASTIGDTTSDLILIFLAAPVAMIALKVGPPEYAMIIFFSLIIISMAATEDPLKGVIATGIGLFLGTVGLDPMRGTPRLEFGILELSDGFQIMPMVIGLLAFSEVLRQIELDVKGRSEKKEADFVPENSGTPQSDKDPNHRVTLQEFKGVIRSIFRSTGIGSAIGIIPGIGTTVAAYLSYISAKRASKHPELFGKGSLEGIAACESGNNAVVGPNLIPLVTLGIPGNLAAALILGGFMIKGLTPGPMFMQRNAPLMYGLFTVLLVSNFYTFMVGNFFIRYIRNVTRIPKPVLFTSILIFSVIGSYVFQSSIFDIFMMFFFGILGYFLTKLQINLPTIIVAFFLGPLFERKIRQALLISGGDISIFFTRPISLAFFLLTIFGVIFLISRKKKIDQRT
jgi:putative tricarboxylic transport membrane protein